MQEPKKTNQFSLAEPAGAAKEKRTQVSFILPIFHSINQPIIVQTLKTKSLLPSLYKGRNHSVIQAYHRFVQDGLGEGRRPEVTGGGLIRSQGGWPKVLALRSKGEKELSDERILGSGDFVEQTLQEAEKRQLQQMKIRRNSENER